MRRRGTALAGVCPSGRPPATTPASRCALHPPGRGYGCARVAIDLPRKAVDRGDVASCSLQPIQLSSSTLRCIRIPFREPPTVSRVCSPSSRRRLCPVPPCGARRAELITGRERPGTVAGPQDPSGAAVGPHLRPWLERSRFFRIGTASVETLPFATSVFFLPRSEGPKPRTPHFIVRRSARPELRRESNAPRYSSLKLRAPSTAESWLLRRASRPPRPPRLCHRWSRFRHAFARCAARQAPRLSVRRGRRATCRSSASFNRTTTSTPRATATLERRHWPAAPLPSDRGQMLSAPGPASRFIPFEG